MQAKMQFTYTLNDSLINELMGLMEYELYHLADEAEKKALQIMIDTLDLITSSPDILRFSTHEMLRMTLCGVDVSAVRIENKSNKNRIQKMMDKKETLHYDIQYFQLWIDEFKSSNKLIRKFLSKLDTDDRSLIKDDNFEKAKPVIKNHMDEFLSICG